jgi:hypothetical protein
MNTSNTLPAFAESRILLIMLRLLFFVSSIASLAGCIHVKMEPIEVHATIDVNVNVNRALDDFFGDLDKKSSTISTPPAK